MHSRVFSELKSRLPHQSFKIGATQVLLSNGIWPALGLKLTDVSVEQKTCDKLSFALNVPQVILPVNLWSLLRGPVRLGRVEVTSGNLHFDYRPCLKPAGTPVATAPSASTPPNWVTHTPLDWRQLGDHMDGFDVKNLTVTYEQNATWKLSVRNASANLANDLSLKGVVDVQKSLPFGGISHVIDIDSEGDQSGLQWLVRSEFKEGRLIWRGTWDMSGRAFSTELQAQQLPLKDVLSELHSMGVVEREVQLKATWLSCAARFEGMIDDYQKMPLHLRDCKVEGAYGEANLGSVDVYPWSQEIIKTPLRLKIHRLQVQPLMEALNRQVLPAVLPRLGSWSGQFDFASPQDWRLDGQLENLEIIFSNQSVRGKQLLRQVHTLAQRQSGGPIVVRVDQIDVQDGSAQGDVQFSLSDDWRTGSFRADLSNVVFAPSVQALLWGGQMRPLKVEGEGRLQDGDLKAWKGNFNLDGFKGDGWAAENLAVKSRFQNGVFVMDSKLGSLEFSPKWRFYPELRGLVGETGAKWKDLNARIDVQKNGGAVHLSTVADSLGTSWRGHGTWVRDGEFTGQLAVRHGGKSQLVAVKGLNNNFHLQAQSEVTE